MNAAHDEQELLAVARAAAQASADELLRRYGDPRGVRTKSSATDPVSDADVAAEDAIRAVLARDRPGDAILGEEGGATAAAAGRGVRWVVDPLDGTANYLYEIPQWCVSVAAEDEDGALVGVVLDPLRGEEFVATRSGAALRDGAPTTGSTSDELATIMVATGFSYQAEERARQAEVLARLLPVVRDVRRFGAAALDLAWLACGRYDAYYERNLKPWDVAAGSLIARRAGLVVRGLPPRAGEPAGVLAAPPALVDRFEQLVAP
jgi:myo-inositol-1(or 4)-monophosphatase